MRDGGRAPFLVAGGAGERDRAARIRWTPGVKCRNKHDRAVKLDSHEIPHIIVSACLEVHQQLGAHLILDAYRECLAQELTMREIIFERGVPVEIRYKGRRVKGAFTFDFIVEHQLIVEVLAFPEDDRERKEREKERVMSLLRLSGYETALLVNFHADDLRNGIKRVIVSGNEPALHYR